MTELLNVDAARETILKSIQQLEGESIALEQAQGRILARDIYADISLPAFNNSGMDGFAVRAEDTTGATHEHPVELRVVVDIPAGAAPQTPILSGQAGRIMTGAPLPDGADAVVPVEDTDGSWDINAPSQMPEFVRVFRSTAAGQNVRPVGEDITQGDRVLSMGQSLRPQEIGVLAALGHSQVEVTRRPRVAILSSGNELIDVSAPLRPGLIRDVNSYTLAGLVADHGGEPYRLPIARDTLEEVRGMFRNALALHPDMIISSAGVSVGAADLIRTVLDELGQINFWRINLRPGKPLAFGQVQGIPFFGLPGNPVSAMVTFDVLVRPALLKQSGRADQWPLATAVVGETIKSDGRRSYVRVKLERRNGLLYAFSTGTQSSGALMSMVLADGLLIIPEEITEVRPGTELQVRLLR